MKKIPLSKLKRVFQRKVYEMNDKINKGHLNAFVSEDLEIPDSFDGLRGQQRKEKALEEVHQYQTGNISRDPFKKANKFYFVDHCM